ncbi:MAG: choice-of-anchor V domain-containing protein [Saprospiraceae bacterium]
MKHLYLTFFVLSSFILLVSNKDGRAASEGEGSTGAPGEPQVCKNCHNGSIVVGMDIFIIDGSDTVKTYEPEKNYTVHVIINPISGPTPKGYGFQLVGLVAPLKVTGPDVKTLTANSPNVKIATAFSTKRLYAEHKGNSLTNTFIVNWQAPPVGSGPVSFYSAGNGNNANNNNSGDGSVKNSVQVNEKVILATNEPAPADFKVYPNPSTGIYYLQGKSLQNVKTILLTNLMGKQLKNIRYSKDMILDLESLLDGIYIVQLLDSNSKIVKTQKLIKRSERP